MEVSIEKIANRIRALMNKTVERGATEAEATSAAAKVQELMSQYNLDAANVEASGKPPEEGTQRVRETNASKAMYAWQKELVAAVARVNFCFHFISESRKPDKNGKMRKVPSHVIVGRQANVVSTQMMFDYLCSTIERLVPITDNKMRLSKAATSWKEGCASRLVERLDAKLNAIMAEQEAVRSQETSTSTGLVLRKVFDNEADANWEFANGYKPGTLAIWREENGKRHVNAIQNDRAETPEEAAQREAWEKKRKKDREREDRARERAWANKDQDAYRAGRQAGANIGLDSQIK